MIEDSRAAVAAMIGAMPENVVFGSGGTEANHLALRGAGRERILVSAVEHDSVLRAVPDAERIPVDRHGRRRLDALANDAGERGSTGTGFGDARQQRDRSVIQPVAEIAQHWPTRMAHSFTAMRSKPPAKSRSIWPRLALICLTLSAHKLGGPPGVGALVLAAGVELTPIFCGGGQERGRRAGTENIVGIIGFGAAARARKGGDCV